MTAATGASTTWLPTLDSPCASVVQPDDRCLTIQEVIELSNAVDPLDRSACASKCPHTIAHTRTTQNHPSITTSNRADVVVLLASHATSGTYSAR